MGDEEYPGDQAYLNWLVDTRTKSLKNLTQSEYFDGIMPAPEDPEPVASELEIRTSQVQTAESETERLRLGLMNLAQQFPEAHSAIETLLGVELERADPPNSIRSTFTRGQISAAQLTQAASRIQRSPSANDYIQRDPEITQSLYREINKYGRNRNE